MLNNTESYLWDSSGSHKRLDGLGAFAQIGAGTVLSNSCVMAFFACLSVLRQRDGYATFGLC